MKTKLAVIAVVMTVTSLAALAASARRGLGACADQSADVLRSASAFAQESTQLAEAALAASSVGSASADL